MGTKPKFHPQLYGIRNIYVSAPLKGTKYIEMLDDNVMTEIDPKMVELDFDEKPHSLKECAEEFLAPEIFHLYRNDTNSFNRIRDCYWAAYKDGIYEAANNLTTLNYSFGQENSTGAVIVLLNEAIIQGSKNAMINLFTVLWCDDKYEDAINLLVQVAQKEDTSLMCLYNLAVFHYLGDEMSNNTLEQDWELSKIYLKRIVATTDVDTLEDADKKVITAANRFLAVLEGSNKECDKSIQPKKFVHTENKEESKNIVESSFAKSDVNTEEYKQLVEKFAETWKKLDATIIFPYLAADFTYGSMWVLTDLDLEGFKEYLTGKFETIKQTNAIPIVEIARNSRGRWTVKLYQNGNIGFIEIEVKDGKIKSAYMLAF